MNNALEFLTHRLGAAVVAFALCAGLAQATITLTTIPSSPINNGELPAVAAEVVSSKTVDKVFLQYRFKDAKALAANPNLEWSDWHNQEMAEGTNGLWNGFIPILPAGDVEWNIYAKYTDGSSDGEIKEIDTDSYDYYHDMVGVTNGGVATLPCNPDYGWQQDQSVGGANSTNFFANTPNGGKWRASGVGWAASNLRTGGQRIPPLGGRSVLVGEGLSYPVLFFCDFDPATTKAFIQTPKFENGLGTISFGVCEIEGKGHALKLQIARTPDEPTSENDWEDVEEFNLPDISSQNPTNFWFTNVVNDISVTYARIVRSGMEKDSTVYNDWFIGIDDIRVSPPLPSISTLKILGELTSDRFHKMLGVTNGGIATLETDPIYGWRQDQSVGGANSTNFYANTPNGGQWRASGVGWAADSARPQNRIPRIGGRGINVAEGLKYPVLFFCDLNPNTTKSFIQTPKLEYGLGTISFGICEIEGKDNALKLQIARTPDEPTSENDWEDVEEFYLPDIPSQNPTNFWFTNIINDISVTYARILRSRMDKASNIDSDWFIGIDDICVTPPTPDLVMKERMRNPGYPSMAQEISVRCLVSNVYERIPAINRKVTVHYALMATKSASVSSWSVTNLTYQCETNGWSLYEGKIPAQGAPGWLHYWFQCDFDGYYYVSPEENGMASPEYLYVTDDENRYGYFSTTNRPPAASGHLLSEVRAEKSRYSKIEILPIVDGVAQERKEMTLVGENLWQASVQIQEGTSVTEAYFVGEKCYEDEVEDFLEDDIFYGDNNQNDDDPDYTYKTPTGGTPDRQASGTNGLTAVKINVSKKGFLVYRLYDSDRDSNLNYTVRRGVFQNFDDWFLSDQHYSDSLYGAGVGEQKADFENWEDTYGFSDPLTENFLGSVSNQAYTIYKTGAPPEPSEFTQSETPSLRNWQMMNFRVMSERVTNSTAFFADIGGEYLGNSNIVVQLNPGGQIRNDGNSVPQGTGGIAALMRCAIADSSKALCTNIWTYDSSSSLTVSTAFSIPEADRANTHYYASIVFDYDEVNESYHELRFTRSDSTDANDTRLRMELFETYNGSSRRIGGSVTNSISNIKQDKTTFFVDAQISRTGSGVSLKLNKMQTAPNPTGAKSNVSTWNGATITGNTSLAARGQVGVTAYDCAPQFYHLVISNGVYNVFEASSTGTLNSRTVPTFAQQRGNLFLGGTDYTTGNEQDDKWYVNGDGVLARRIPSKTIQLFTRPFSTDTGNSASDTFLDSRTIKSLKFQELSWPDVHSWQKIIAILKVSGEDGDGNCVVVDSVSATPWRAGTRRPEAPAAIPDAYDYQSEGQQNSLAGLGGFYDRWLIFEGLAMTNRLAYSNRSVAAAFCRSQANPDLVQAIYSPKMTNGVGTVRFDYQVTGQPGEQVVYAVEYTKKPLNGAEATFDDEPVTAAVFTNSVGQSDSHSCDIRVNWGYEEDDPTIPLPMRMRIRVLPQGTSPEATLWLDNLFVNDSPEETEEMWKMYNGRLATAEAETDYTRIYGGFGTTLYLNNSPVRDVAAHVDSYSAKKPYLQAPKMDEGIGEIGFVYRSYDTTSTGMVSIAVSSDETKPFDDWLVVTNFLVSGTGYVPFDDPEIYFTTNYFVRIFTETNNADRSYGRVCIDNVVVMEPSRPSYEIVKVSLVPEYPVVSDERVAVKAQIGHMMQTPTNICLYVSYVTSTNTWGYGNWWKPLHEFGHPETLELHQVGDTKSYQTAEGEGLPATSDLANEVVQYVVWGTHSKVPEDYNGTDVIFEKGVFRNPPNYGAIDLNKTYCTTNDVKQCMSDSVTPYYFVFSSTPGSVWINEIWNMHTTTSANKVYPDGSDGYEFVELAGKSGTDISGWQLNIYLTESETPSTNIVFGADMNIVFGNGTKIPQGSTGWGYIVIGDIGIAESTAFTNSVPDESVIIELPRTGPKSRDSFKGAAVAFELLRDNGIVEQVLYVKQSESDEKRYPWNSKYSDLPRWIHPPKTDNSTARKHSYSLIDDLFDGTGNPSPQLYEHMSKIEFDSSDEDLLPQLAYTNSIAGDAGVPRVWWWYPAEPTPGRVNDNQSFRAILADTFELESYIDGGAPYHGTQNGKIDEIWVNVDSGSWTQIVYVAHSWYKIVALESNGVKQKNAEGKSRYTFTIPSMDKDIRNKVTFGPKTAADYANDPDANKRWTDAILDWFRRRGWTEEQIAAGDGDEYEVPDEYLMDTSPILFTEVGSQTDSIALDGDILTLGVGLSRMDGASADSIEGGSPVTSGINGVVNIYGVANLADFGKSETKIASAQIPAGSFNGTNRVDKSFNAGSLGLNFFKWRLEEE